MKRPRKKTGPPEKSAPAEAGTRAGAVRTFQKRVGAQGQEYTDIRAGAIQTIDPAYELPLPVVVYVSRGLVYQLDQNLTVVAYGRALRGAGE